MSQSNSLWNRRSYVLLLLAGLLLSTSVLAGPLQISEASWDARRHADALYINGTGEDFATVTLSDADSGEPLAIVSADRRGRWQYQSINPSTIPCRVKGVSKDVTVERIVSNAGTFPGGCGPGAVNEPPQVSITAPPDGSNYTQGDSISFTGSATDEDGNLSAGLAWTSSRDGSIG
ncbi:MAG: Ig-like domain-containing protein, partial [Xanthomonadales bacterium]|nr:Ig-like domain-containing protein [Xanthomonadales bacterium]